MNWSLHSMNIFLTEVSQTLFPRNEAKHGPLPPLLVGMTLVTGLVDAISYLLLGHVFVANMTGNIVFLAFALAGASGFSIPASLVAVGAFSLGSLGGGYLGSRLGSHRGNLLSTAATIQALFFVIAIILTIFSGNSVSTDYKYALIIVLGIAMGIQNAAARKLAVPDLTTTVLTLTIVGISADSRIVGGNGSKAGRRLISVVTMFVGALIGGILTIHVSIIYPLLIALIIKICIAVAARVLSRADAAWVHAK
jgi:uncharacterized membrane protein YoaK (UPF0700 family)